MLPEDLTLYTQSLTRFLDSLDALVAHLDSAGHIVYCNEPFRRLVQCSDDRNNVRLCALLAESQQGCLDGLELGQIREVDLSLARGVGWVPVRAQITRLTDGYLVLAHRPGVSDDEAFERMSQLTNELADISRELKRKNLELQRAQEQIKTLTGLIPICASCKRIRTDDGFWMQVEEYVTEHTEAVFSHGICPDCMRRLYGDLMDDEAEVRSEKPGR